jgi:hypothetical protein
VGIAEEKQAIRQEVWEHLSEERLAEMPLLQALRVATIQA